MTKIRVHNFSVSLDGYAAGPDQTLDNPLGVGGERLHKWAVATAAFQRLLGTPGVGTEGLDSDFIARGDEGIRATVMGRNMFGPIRGGWGDESWRGWWGDTPPFHHDVFVLTHQPRASFTMDGDTTFHFVTEGLDAALDAARAAAGDGDIRIGGGVATIQQCLRIGVIDDLHVAIVPILLGRGERLFANLDGAPPYECVELVSSDAVTHVRLAPVKG
jgi:dihydrofolate reductase